MRFKIWKSKRRNYGYEPDIIVETHEQAQQRAQELRSSGIYSVIWTEA